MSHRPFREDRYDTLTNPGDLFSSGRGDASWPNRTDPDGSRGLDDHLTRDFHRDIGAEIMGRNKFGPLRGPWTDHEWQGWWGEERLRRHDRPRLSHLDRSRRTPSGSR